MVSHRTTTASLHEPLKPPAVAAVAVLLHPDIPWRQPSASRTSGSRSSTLGLLSAVCVLMKSLYKVATVWGVVWRGVRHHDSLESSLQMWVSVILLHINFNINCHSVAAHRLPEDIFILKFGREETRSVLKLHHQQDLWVRAWHGGTTFTCC